MSGSNKTAPWITHNVRQTLLREYFPELSTLWGAISTRQPTHQILRCDNFLWGFLKSLVYTNHSKPLGEMKNIILVAIANIDADNFPF